MPNLLPSVSGGHACLDLPIESWWPGLKEIAHRHGIQATSGFRFAAGMNPVFELDGKFVVKLVPALAARTAEREIQCLEWLASRGALPLPVLLGSGVIEAWTYLVSTRLPGRPLTECWPELNFSAQSAIARELGGILAVLHRLPLGGFVPGGLPWSDFLPKRIGVWAHRSDVAQLPAGLRESAPEYIAAARLGKVGAQDVFLHGDLVPENCLVSNERGTWRITGVIDFGNALTGPGLFDLTAPTVLLAPGDGRIVRSVFEGYGMKPFEIAGLRPKLMACTLVHPMADLVQCLGLFPELSQAGSWNEVAEKLWPDG